MSTNAARLSRRRLLQGSGAALALGLIGTTRFYATSTVQAHEKETIMTQHNGTDTLTIALVHGAFADASSWNGVIEGLLASGHQVVAPSNPLRGISIDSDYIASYLNQIPGPVLAVGHSYGGAIITNAAAKAPNVVGLVYVAGFAPEVGEILGEVEKGSKDSVLNTVLFARSYPTGQGEETEMEFLINPARFHDSFSADLPLELSALLAAGQRPASALAFGQPTTAAAWKTLPSWAVVATGDKAAGADVTRAMAQRAGATITEVEGSHVIMISQPRAVTEVILTAVAAVSAAQPSA